MLMNSSKKKASSKTINKSNAQERQQRMSEPVDSADEMAVDSDEGESYFRQANHAPNYNGEPNHVTKQRDSSRCESTRIMIEKVNMNSKPQKKLQSSQKIYNYTAQIASGLKGIKPRSNVSTYSRPDDIPKSRHRTPNLDNNDLMPNMQTQKKERMKRESQRNLPNGKHYSSKEDNSPNPAPLNIQDINLQEQFQISLRSGRRPLKDVYNKYDRPIDIEPGQVNTMYTTKNLKSTDQAPHFDNPVNNFKIPENEIAELSSQDSDSNVEQQHSTDFYTQNNHKETSVQKEQEQSQGPKKQKNANKKRFEAGRIFYNLTCKVKFTTANQIVNLLYVQKLDRIISLQKKDDVKLIVQQFSVNDKTRINEYVIEGEALKGSHIEQNKNGTLFALPYMDNGVWFLLLFSLDEVIFDININDHFGFDNSTLPLANFEYSYSCCTFIGPNKLIYNLFERRKMLHHHFIIDGETCNISELTTIKLTYGSIRNIPVKTVFNYTKQEVHCFYRQGVVIQLFTDYDDIPEMNLIDAHAMAETVLYKDKVMITQDSDSVIIFEQVLVFNKYEMRRVGRRHGKWQKLHSYRQRGQLFNSGSSNQLFIANFDNIHCLKIEDENNFNLKKENMILNFMECGTLMSSDDGRVIVSYKQREQNFTTFHQKFLHDFEVILKHLDLEHAQCVCLENGDIAIANEGIVYFLDGTSYQQIGMVDLELQESKTREPIVILNMNKSLDDCHIAVLVGKQLINDQEEIVQISILRRERKRKRYFHFKDMDLHKYNMSSFCKNVQFDKTSKDPKIFMVSDEAIISLDLLQEQIVQFYDFKLDMADQPEFFLFNDDQTCCILATGEDALFIDLEEKKEVDVDTVIGVSCIRTVYYFNKHFYLLANKRFGKIGLYLCKMNTETIEDGEQCATFIINKQTRFDIGDASINIMTDYKGNQKLIVCYKTIYVNKFTMQVIDLNTLHVEQELVTDQLWESSVKSFLNQNQKEQLKLSMRGLSLVLLDPQVQHKHFINNRNQRMIVHSLYSCKHFLFSDRNTYEIAQSNDHFRVSINNCYFDNNSFSQLDSLYSIEMRTLETINLLLLQSLFHCETSHDITRMISNQNNNDVFYNIYLELDKQNMIYLIAFEGQSIKLLLNDCCSEYFQNKNSPIILMGKTPVKCFTIDDRGQVTYEIRFRYRSPIDRAFKANQISAVQVMIQYVVEHQSNFSFSSLFIHNIVALLQGGIRMNDVFTNVFKFNLEFNEWPGLHQSPDDMICPYNESPCDLRYKYNKIFSEIESQVVKQSVGNNVHQKQSYCKIKYTLNLLPSILADEEISKNFFQALQDYGENDLTVFESDVIQQMISFNWDAYGSMVHNFSALMFFTHLVLMSIYVYATYISGVYGDLSHPGLPCLLMPGLFYLIFYEVREMYVMRRQYWGGQWNLNDLNYMLVQIINIYVHFSHEDLKTLVPIVTMVIVLFLTTLKSLNYLQIIESVSILVNLVTQVIYDLRLFMIFFLILVYMFALVVGTIGVGNLYLKGGEAIVSKGKGSKKKMLDLDNYYFIEQFFGNIIDMYRYSLGDIDIGRATILKDEFNMVYWVVYLITVFMLTILFLNFIIAEAGASYSKVSENIDNIMKFEKVNLLVEADIVLVESMKNQERYPRFLIVREKEE